MKDPEKVESEATSSSVGKKPFDESARRFEPDEYDRLFGLGPVPKLNTVKDRNTEVKTVLGGQGQLRIEFSDTGLSFGYKAAGHNGWRDEPKMERVVIPRAFAADLAVLFEDIADEDRLAKRRAELENE